MKHLLGLGMLAIGVLSAADAKANVEYQNYARSGRDLVAKVTTLEKTGKRIVLIPMVHVSTGRFYRGVRKELRGFADQNAVILQEGVSVCGPKGDTLPLAWVPTSQLDPESATALLRDTRNGRTPSEQQIRNAGFEQVNCDDIRPTRTKRFFGKVRSSLFSTYAIVGHLFLLRVQSAARLYPKDGHRASGDIIGTHLRSIADQLVFNSMVDCFESFVGVAGRGRCGNVVRWLKSSPEVNTDSIIITLRNQILQAKILRALGFAGDPEAEARYTITPEELGRTEDVAVLPWGSAHFDGNNAEFVRELVEQGFELQETAGEIPVTSCSRARRNPLLRATSGDVCR